MSDRIAHLKQELQHWDDLAQKNSRNPNGFVRRGMVQFKLGNIESSIEDFDQAERLDPRLTPYLWQRGLSYYYAQRFEAGAKQFEVDLTVNGQDVEETVWRYLCLAQSRGVDVAIATLLPVRQDPRPFMRRIYDLYAGQCDRETILAEAAREDQRGKFYRHLYLGLYAEAQQDAEQAKHHLAIAADQYPLDDYMWHLAVVHCQLRGWA
jgi:tetratricopeptide (TPR) repeat protein